jgi:hypothetical protein
MSEMPHKSPNVELHSPEEELLAKWQAIQADEQVPSELKKQFTSTVIEHFEDLKEKSFVISGMCGLWYGRSQDSGYYGRMIGREVPFTPDEREAEPFTEEQAKLLEYLPLLYKYPGGHKHLLEFEFAADPNFTWVVEWENLKAIKPIPQAIEAPGLKVAHGHDLLHLGSRAVKKALLGDKPVYPTKSHVTVS